LKENLEVLVFDCIGWSDVYSKDILPKCTESILDLGCRDYSRKIKTGLAMPVPQELDKNYLDFLQVGSNVKKKIIFLLLPIFVQL